MVVQLSRNGVAKSRNNIPANAWVAWQDDVLKLLVPAVRSRFSAVVFHLQFDSPASQHCRLYVRRGSRGGIVDVHGKKARLKWL